MSEQDHKKHLHNYLREARQVLLWKLDGLSEYDVRRPFTPTGTNLLGLVKHQTRGELQYFGRVFGRSHDVPLPGDGTSDSTADMWAMPDETRPHIIQLYQRAWVVADATIEALPIDAPGRVPWWGDDGDVTLHQILVHVTAETHRHAGHADIVRELIDGFRGDARGRDQYSDQDASWWLSYRARLEQAARAAR